MQSGLSSLTSSFIPLSHEEVSFYNPGNSKRKLPWSLLVILKALTLTPSTQQGSYPPDIPGASEKTWANSELAVEADVHQG